jgi:hypothetical protein
MPKKDRGLRTPKTHYRGKPIYTDALDFARDFAGTRVKAYRNLHIEDRVVYSVVSMTTGLVLAYTEALNLDVVRFVTQRSGRDKVRQERRKNVHAWATGWVSAPPNIGVDSFKVTYNPYLDESFVSIGEHTGRRLPIYRASSVYLGQCGVRAYTLDVTRDLAALRAAVERGERGFPGALNSVASQLQATGL